MKSTTLGIIVANKKRTCGPHSVDEGRKRTILIAASILVPTKVAELGSKSSPASEATMSDAISVAERIMQRIDQRWQDRQTSR
jgi:hypothetical protein